MASIISKSIRILKAEGLKIFLKRCAGFGKWLFKRSYTYIFFLDFKNKIKYGTDAPLYAERIWINPSEIDIALVDLDGKYSSGQVVNVWPPNGLKQIPITSIKKIKYCIDHFVNGMAWENTGIYEHMMTLIAEREIVDDCMNRNDVVNRYNQIDAMFNQIKMEGKIRPRKEINPKNFREDGGVYIHLGPNGELFFGGSGIHRFCIARILELPVIPAQIGCVHQSAIPYLSKLRQRDYTEHHDEENGGEKEC